MYVYKKIQGETLGMMLISMKNILSLFLEHTTPSSLEYGKM